MTESIQRIAIVGGTFEPMHRGHIEPLLDVIDQMEWDRILYVPAAQQPFKQDRQTAAPLHRWAMAALATSSHPRLHLSSIELDRGEMSYSVDTLEALSRQKPGAAFDWVIGDDNLELLMQWRRIDRIFELCNFVVLRRGDSPVPESLRERVVGVADRGRAGHLILLENRRTPVSSTEIRERIQQGKSIAGLVSEEVEEYIRKYGLYAAGEKGA